MKRFKLTFLILLIIPFTVEQFAQSKDPNEILERVKVAFDKIEDYEVDIEIKIDVSFLKVPDSKAKLYYKQPDKIHVESEKFALLPRQGLDFSPLGLLSGKYTALYEREDTINGIQTSVVKVIPLGNDGDIILSTFWIDQSRNLIIKVESTKKPIGTFSINFTYEDYNNTFELPSQIEFTFTIDKMMLPRGMDGQMNSDAEDKNDKAKTTTGKVFITYSNYKVNQGLPDEIFDDAGKEN
jgi:outer membrane lipoprotein-sorting protein